MSNTAKPRIVFFGTSDFAVPAFQALVREGHHIVAVVTKPDKPTGRARVMRSSPIKEAAQEHKLSILTPSSLKENADFNDTLRILQPTLCIIAAYGLILPSAVLEIPEKGSLNIHPSLLPKYRGPSPIQGALRDGVSKTGVTLMVVDEEMDHGPIVASQTVSVPQDWYYEELAATLADVGAELLVQTIPTFCAGTVTLIPQDHSVATYTKLLKQPDGRIEWNRPVEHIYNHIRAFSHEPGAWTTWNGTVVKIIRAMMSLNTCAPEPGVLCELDTTLNVSTGNGTLHIETLQPAGSRVMSAEEFVRGRPGVIHSMFS